MTADAAVSESRELTVDGVARELTTGTSVVVRGVAGIGKTMLLRRVAQQLVTAGFGIVRAAASETAQRFGFGAFAGLVPPGASSGLDRAAAMSATFAAMTRTVLMVDDAHLLDDESAALVHHLVANSVVPTLCAVRDATPCPDAIRRLWSNELCAVRTLGVLGSGELDALSEALLGGLASRATLQVLAASSEGNPLQLRAVIDAGRAAGTLRLVDGVWWADRLAGGRTTRELFRARIDASGPDERLVANALAVGGAMPTRVLNAAVGIAAAAKATAAGWTTEHDGTTALLHGLLADAVAATIAEDESVAVLKHLVAAVEADDPTAADVVVIHASWLVRLGERGGATPGVLMAAGRRLLADGKVGIAETLAESAVRDGGGTAAQALLAQCRGALGRRADVGDTAIGFEALRGRIKGFGFGLHSDETVRNDILDAMYALTDPVDRGECDACDAAFSLLAGGPIAPHLARLLGVISRYPASPGALIACHVACEALNEAGRSETACSVSARVALEVPPDDLYMRAQTGRVGIEALLRLGRVKDAKVETDRLFRTIPDDEFVPTCLPESMKAQCALLSGEPDEAARLFASLATRLGGVSAAGTFALASAALTYARAWRGDPVAPPEPSPRVGPVARHALAQVELYRCLTLVALGHFRGARTAALELADRAQVEGRTFVALEAVHLAARIEGTRALVRQARNLADQCEGDLAPLIADHVDAGVSSDGPALEKVALRFEAAGYLAYAAEAYQSAAVAHRGAGQRGASSRCLHELTRLVRSGVTMTPVGRRATRVEALTPREREVAMLAAGGATNQAMADQLTVSRRTVETHLQSVYRKLGAHDRESLAQQLRSTPL